MSVPVKLYWEATPGGSMGGHSLLMVDEDVYVGHFYEDASDGVDVDAIFHLIAAAPELLEALHKIEQQLDYGQIDAARRLATDAIAKATGEQP